MEQYWMPRELDLENLRLCLDNYEAISLFIRDCGGIREDGKYDISGRVKVNENLEGRDLDFRKDVSGLYLLVDSNEEFHFPLMDYHKGFSLAYERIRPTADGIGRMVMLGTSLDDPYGQVDHYGLELPEPRTSTLRTVLDDHLLEISFAGRVNLKFHSWWDKKAGWKFWTVATPEEGQEIQRAKDLQEAIRKQETEYSEDK